MKEVFPLQYWGPITYYAGLMKSSNPVFEIWETFPRHSYRNRCEIPAANGLINLSVPLKKPQGSKTMTKNVEIDHHQNWQEKQWKSILSTYAKSPYFEHYGPDVYQLIFRKDIHLIQLNKAITQWIFQKLNIQHTVSFTEQFQHKQTDNLRTYDQKVPQLPHYFQVFEEKTGFCSDTSILDGFFNLGPELRLYLNNI